MYIWTGLIFDKKDEDYIRKICKKINKNYSLSELSFTLPQHISLKTSFYYDNYNEIIDYLKIILSNINSLKVNIIGIKKINNGVIWLEVENTKELRDIHNLLNDKLLNKYSIPSTNYDGENFIFHSTLFQDSSISNKHNKMIDELLSEFEFPFFYLNQIHPCRLCSSLFETYDEIDTSK